jgi:hypothetical protein
LGRKICQVSDTTGACSLQKYNLFGHDRGELWTIDKIHFIHQQVKDGVITETLQNDGVFKNELILEKKL